MHFEDGEFAKRSHNRYVLDEQISIYGLPPIGGVPREITDARAMCANQDNSAFLNLPTADWSSAFRWKYTKYKQK